MTSQPIDNPRQNPLNNGGLSGEGKKVLMVSLKKDLVKRIIKWLLRRKTPPSS